MLSLFPKAAQVLSASCLKLSRWGGRKHDKPSSLSFLFSHQGVVNFPINEPITDPWAGLGTPVSSLGLHCQEPWEGCGAARPGQPFPARTKPQTEQDQSSEFLTNARAWGCAVSCETTEETPCCAVPTSHQKQSGFFSPVSFSEKYFPLNFISENLLWGLQL